MEMTPGGGFIPRVAPPTIPQTHMPTMTGHPILGVPQQAFGPAPQGGFNPLHSLFKTMFSPTQGGQFPGMGMGGSGDWMQRLMGIFGSQGGPSGSPFGMFGGMFGPRAGGSGGLGQGSDYGGFGAGFRQ